MSLTTECMIINICVSRWAARKQDKAAAKKLNADANASDDASQVHKVLVPKESLDKLTSLDQAMRNQLKKYSLPWKEGGDRIMPRRMYEQFIREHGALRAEFDAEADRFVNEIYPPIRAQAAFRMGSMFDPTDYPEPHELRRRFKVSLEIDPVTTAEDFRVKISDAAMTVERQMTERVTRAMGQMVEEFEQVVGHFASAMENTDTKFRPSTIERLVGLADRMEAFNITNDATIRQICERLREAFAPTLEAKDLRKDDALRQSAAEEARKIMEEMSGFANAFKRAA